jgi:hypothetical protein
MPSVWDMSDEELFNLVNPPDLTSSYVDPFPETSLDQFTGYYDTSNDFSKYNEFYLPGDQPSDPMLEDPSTWINYGDKWTPLGDSWVNPQTGNLDIPFDFSNIQNPTGGTSFWSKVGDFLSGGTGGSPLGTIAKAAGSIAGSALQSNASNKAAETQAAAAKYAADLQYKAMSDALAFQKEQWGTSQANLAPWLESGKLGLSAINQGMGLGTDNGSGGYGDLAAPYTKEFSYADFQAPVLSETNDPGLAFRLAEGQKALDRSLAARGGALSGASAKAAARYGQDYASNEYGNVYNRALQGYNTNYNNALQGFNTNYNVFQNNQANRFNRLASMSGLGQTTANQLNSAGQNFANQSGNLVTTTAQNAGELATQAANARASGYVANGNTWSNAVNGIGNSIYNQTLLSKILNGYQ